MSVAHLVSRSKVNLRLKVVGRRNDGYHLLEMINCSTSLSDKIEIELNESGRITLQTNWPECADVEQNLATRALVAFAKCFNLQLGADIKLEKHIPLGGGLGGGSGNAALVLRYLQEKFEASPDIVSTLALELGADVPYMLRGGLARVSGIGEVVEPLTDSDLHDHPAILVLPPFGMSTAAVFSELRKLPLSELSSPDFDNDLFPIALKLEPRLGEIYRALAKNSEWVVSMSGSGSTLFVLPRKKGDLAELDGQVRSALKGIQADCRAITLDASTL